MTDLRELRRHDMALANYHLRVEDGRLVALLPDGRVVALDDEDDVLAIADAADDDGVDLLCSSSLDFPEEHTNDAAVIRLCKRIRGERDDEPFDAAGYIASTWDCLDAVQLTAERGVSDEDARAIRAHYAARGFDDDDELDAAVAAAERALLAECRRRVWEGR